LFITPNWPAPDNIKAVCTTRKASLVKRQEGASLAPYNAFNLATHVGDDASHIQQNRQILKQQACLPNAPFWLDQRHTVDALCLDPLTVSDWQPVVADASWTTQSNQVSVVMTADCIPLLVTNRAGTLVSSIHAGWKGLAEGIVIQTLQALPECADNLLVWIGPCIRQNHFEVGEDVFDIFTCQNMQNKSFFKPLTDASDPKFLADLAGLLKLQLANLGVTSVYDSELCSYADSERFYSYRRDGVTGRMASLIWLTR